MPGSGNALSFDGIDDHVELGSSFTSQNFTVDMWIKPGASQITYADIIDNNHTDLAIELRGKLTRLAHLVRLKLEEFRTWVVRLLY